MVASPRPNPFLPHTPRPRSLGSFAAPFLENPGGLGAHGAVLATRKGPLAVASSNRCSPWLGVGGTRVGSAGHKPLVAAGRVDPGMGFPLAFALCLFAAGWGLAFLLRQSLPRLWEAVLLALGGSGFWLFLLGFLGLRWELWLAILPLGVGLAGSCFKATYWFRWIAENWLKTALGAAALGVLVHFPAWGWDFRYQWGLKAKVFAAFRGHDFFWLGQEGVGFAHPGYPPLWPDALAFPVLLGLPVESSAGIWTALLRLGLAGVCWHLAAGGSQTLAALVGFFSPSLFRPDYSGYAEPLVAFLLGCSLLLFQEKGLFLPWLGWSLLPLAKGEGLVWLSCLAGASLLRKSKLPKVVLLASLVPALAWFLQVSGVLIQPLPVSSSQVLQRLFHFPQAFFGLSRGAFYITLSVLLAVFVAWNRTPLALATVAFAGGLVLVYLLGSHPLPWWLENSWGRVLAVPLPLLLATALGPAPAPSQQTVGTEEKKRG